jgi:hypothetical protein
MASAKNLKCGGRKKGYANGGLKTDPKKVPAKKAKNIAIGDNQYPAGTPINKVFTMTPEIPVSQQGPDYKYARAIEASNVGKTMNRYRYRRLFGKDFEGKGEMPWPPSNLDEILSSKGMNKADLDKWDPELGFIDPGGSKSVSFEDGGFLNLDTEAKQNALSSGITAATDMGAQALEESKARDFANYDSRYNPADVMRKGAAKDTGAALLKGAGTGAAIGTMILPGIGTAIGAGAGALVSGIGRLFGAKGRKEDIAEASSKWSGNWARQASAHYASTGYKDGGKKGGEIEGKGGPKSDSIKMKAKDGSFFVPAENADIAKELGMTYLGWGKDKTAARDNGGTGVNVSDGEVFFTPEEVGTLEYYGHDLSKLAPNAEPGHRANKSTEPMKRPSKTIRPIGTPALSSGVKGRGKKILVTEDQGNFADGGWKFDEETGYVVNEAGDIGYDESGNEYSRDTSGKLSLDKNATAYGASIYDEYSDPSTPGHPQYSPPGPTTPEIMNQEGASSGQDKEEFKRKWYDLAPEIAGAIQMAGGAAGLADAGQKPDLHVSHTLKKLSSEVRRLSQFGYEPAVLNALNNQIERSRRDVSKAVTESGGSAMEQQAKLQKLLGTTIDKKAEVAYADAREKARKWADVLKVDSAIAGQEFDINKINLSDWYKTQDVYANMLSAGVSNVIGARQLKKEQDVMREIGPATPTFSRT